jgi:hypothetical protein
MSVSPVRVRPKRREGRRALIEQELAEIRDWVDEILDESESDRLARDEGKSPLQRMQEWMGRVNIAVYPLMLAERSDDQVMDELSRAFDFERKRVPLGIVVGKHDRQRLVSLLHDLCIPPEKMKRASEGRRVKLFAP